MFFVKLQISQKGCIDKVMLKHLLTGSKKFGGQYHWLMSAAFMLPVAAATHAGNVYTFKNKDGETLLTNVVDKKRNPSGDQFQEYTTRVKVTYYADTNVHSYNNWGGTEAAVYPSFSKNKNAYDTYISLAASNYKLEHGLIKAIMHTESGFNPNARSPVGAQGLMQLMPATARRFAVSNAYDPQQNIDGAAKYLSWLLKRFNYNTELALAAYNAGEGNVDKYRGIPPFRETQDYVRRVMSRYRNLYSGGVASSTAPVNNIATPAYTASSYKSNTNNHSYSVNGATASIQVSNISNSNPDAMLSSSDPKTYVTENAYTSSQINH